jgi:hypothetical protein
MLILGINLGAPRFVLIERALKIERLFYGRVREEVKLNTFEKLATTAYRLEVCVA